MNTSGILYIDKDTPFHRMDGSIKFLLFITWYIVVFMFMDLRIFTFLGAIGIIMLYISQIPYKIIRPLLWIMIVFNIMNSIFILLMVPNYGVDLVGTSTPIINIGYAKIDIETLVYVATLGLKYANLFPITIIFMFTTHPSRFASSLNKIRIPYKIAYSISIAFRYIPDIQKEFRYILNAQQARGVSFKKGEAPLSQRIKNVVSIAVPLVITSLQRIDTVTNAMELRGFGKHKKRTWYNGTKIQRADYITIASCVLLVIISILIKSNLDNKLLWYPF